MDDQWLRRFVVVVIIVVSSMIALFTIGAAILHPYISTDTTPTILENWGGLIIGFYFGTFVGLLKDWLGTRREENKPPATQTAAALPATAQPASAQAAVAQPAAVPAGPQSKAAKKDGDQEK